MPVSKFLTGFCHPGCGVGGVLHQAHHFCNLPGHLWAPTWQALNSLLFSLRSWEPEEGIYPLMPSTSGHS